MRRDKNKNKMVCLSGEVHCHCQTEEMPLQKQIETYKKKKSPWTYSCGNRERKD